MKYRHKLTGQILTLKKSFGNVGTFYCEEKPFYNIIINTCVCLMENVERLEQHQKQQVLIFI